MNELLGVLNLSKILHLLLALYLIQILGNLLVRFLGASVGTVLLGFFGGLVSSTALTATLAKESHSLTRRQGDVASLAYLSGILAMLAEAAILTFYGTEDITPKFAILFAGPILMVLGLMHFSFGRSKQGSALILDQRKIDYTSIFKLAGFILFALALSKWAAHAFGSRGLLPVTYLVSLAEVHGSIIANLQLHETGVADTRLLGDLITTSLAASFTSKLALVLGFGNRQLKRRVLRWTGWIALATLASWGLFRIF